MLTEQPYDAQVELYEKLFSSPIYEDARKFIGLYCDYVHAIDDCVDEVQSTEQVAKTIKLAALVFNCNYWNKWKQTLYVLERMIYCNYFDSTVWEKSEEEWKKRDAKVLNQSGYLMIFAVILIELGEDKLKEVSLRMREYMHRTQGHHEL